MTFENVFEPIVSGRLEVRLARTEAEVEAAQRLRYRIFCEEMGGKANAAVQAQKRDFDEYDPYCHHLLVIDREKQGDTRVVGTYRLLTRENMKPVGKFYTETEYDITPLKKFTGPVLELGRSCVEAEYRTRPVIQLLWLGVGNFIAEKDIGLMFGCASFHGDDAEQHKIALSFLYHYHLAPAEIRPRALPEQFVEMDRMAKEDISPKAVVRTVPPLIKGYLRVGGYVGDGAVLDHAYNTTDVSIVVQTDQVKQRYLERYVPDGE
ncbi:MAG: GNAT family N-acyltransferase [Alphaproteobacteria bacterium]